jgi:hypothetical protein
MPARSGLQRCLLALSLIPCLAAANNPKSPDRKYWAMVITD